MKAIGKTDIGKHRNNNEDAIFFSNESVGSLPNLCIVSDGMGGHNAGEVASNESISFFLEYVRALDGNDKDYLDMMISGLVYSNEKVYEMSVSDNSYSGMGTTFSAVTVADGKIFIAHVGDSRVYVINDNSIEQITSDHTYVNEMLKSGQITKSEVKTHPQRNSLLKVLGTHSSVEADGIVAETGNISKILLCSDGLSNMLTDEEIFAIISKNQDIESAACELVDEANGHGGIDNVSVVLIDLGR